MTDLPAQELIRETVERILRLKSDQDAISDDVKEIYAEAKARGLDKTALGKVVADARARDKDPAKFAEMETLVEMYSAALTHTHAHARAA